MTLTNILDSIVSILVGSSLSEQSLLSVIERLESFGYTIKETDNYIIAFSAQKVENTIKNECNVTVIPDGLINIAIDMICGEVLFTKKQTGQLEGFSLETSLKSVQAGDTTVSFAVEGSMTPEQRLNNLISYLLSNGRGEFVCYRKIKW